MNKNFGKGLEFRSCSAVFGQRNPEWMDESREYYALNFGGDSCTVLLTVDKENEHYSVCGIYQRNWMYHTCTNSNRASVITEEQANALLEISDARCLFESMVDGSTGVRKFIIPEHRDCSLPEFEKAVRGMYMPHK